MQTELLPYYRVLLIFIGVFTLINSPIQAQNTTYTLVIDPGHGGRDPGKPGSSNKMMHEKDINLAVSLKLGAYIKESLPNIKVLYSRTTDEYVSLQDRADFANENQADFFISIHSNSSPKSSISGTETHIYHHQQAASKRLALLIEEEFREKAARKSRGVIDAAQRGQNLYVTQYTNMPSVLVEIGYLTNAQEEAYLNSGYGQALISSAIFRAFRSFTQSTIPTENRSSFYKVQIMASQQPVDLEKASFSNLDETVIEYINREAISYKYKYLIGREYDFQRAKALLKKIVNLGFKDAFITKFEEG